MIEVLRRWAGVTRLACARAVEDYRQRHVPARCRASRCDCPCGYCRHDGRHILGGKSK